VGQVGIILLMYLLLIYPLGKHLRYKQWVVNPLSLLIALIAGYWTVERIWM